MYHAPVGWFIIFPARELRDRLAAIEDKGELIMAKLTDLTAAIAKLKSTTSEALARISADVQNLKDKITDQGDSVKTSDLDAVLASINEVTATLATVDPDPENPAPAPPSA